MYICLYKLQSRGGTYIGIMIVTNNEYLVLRTNISQQEQINVWKQSVTNVISAGVETPQIWGQKEFSI